MRSCKLAACLLALMLLGVTRAGSQMRQVFLDQFDQDNSIVKMSFYGPSQGYVAFEKWIGFTNDSGRTFIQKHITLGNVNFNGYSPNLTFGFGISGVNAFNQDTLIVYGHYGAVPSILYSTNGGNTYKLVYQSQYNALQLTPGVMDMVFPQNNHIGFAVEADRIIKSTDRGKTWSVSLTDQNAFYNRIIGIDNNHLYAYSTTYPGHKMMKTTNGATWQQVNLPPGDVMCADFLTQDKGWLNINESGEQYVFYTQNGGAAWTQMNHPVATPFISRTMRFVNDSTGFGQAGFSVYKTTDSGKVWQRLPRDNGFQFLYYGHNTLHFWNDQQFWAGGNHGFLELSTNGGGTVYPGAFFNVDTLGLDATATVNLVNYSKPGYQYKWYRNSTLIGTSYHASYIHNPASLEDTIRLVVTDGVYSDTAMRLQYFNPPPPPPVPYFGWDLKPNNISDNLLDVRFFGDKGIIVGENGLYYTTTGADNPNGWTRFVIANSPADSLLLQKTKFSKLAANDLGTLFYAIGEDTVDHRAVLFRLNVSDLSYAFLYYGSPGTALHSVCFAPYYNHIFAVGENGLFLAHFFGASAVAQSQLPDQERLVGVFDEKDVNHPDHLGIVADSAVYLGRYENGVFAFEAGDTKKLPKRFKFGFGHNGFQFLAVSEQNVLHTMSFGATNFYIDSIKRVKPSGLNYNSISGSTNPAHVYLATDAGIYRLFAQGNGSTIEYQPTSLRRHITGIWFKQRHSYDTAYAVGKNGVLFKSINYGGPTVPYADISAPGNCLGDPTILTGSRGSASDCRWYLDGALVSTSCNSPGISIATPGYHTLTHVVSNIHACSGCFLPPCGGTSTSVPSSNFSMPC